MPGVDDGVLRQLGEPFERFGQLLRIATRQVRPTNAARKEGIAAEDRSFRREVIADGSWRVAGRGQDDALEAYNIEASSFFDRQ